MEPKPNFRVQYVIDLDQQKDLEDLMRKGKLSTKTELLDNAIALLRWAAKEREKNRSIASVSEDLENVRVLEMPFLQNVASYGQRAAREPKPVGQDDGDGNDVARGKR